MMIPKPMPDELMFGHLGRIQIVNGAPTMRDAAMQLTSYVTKGSSKLGLLLPCIAEASGFEHDQYLEQHTLALLFGTIVRAPFTQCKRDGEFRQYQSNALAKGIRAYGFSCPLCIRDDIRQYGIAYWHRIHHLPGVDWCFVHQCDLNQDRLPGSFENLPSLDSSYETASALIDVKPICKHPIVLRLGELLYHFLRQPSQTLANSVMRPLLEVLARPSTRMVGTVAICKQMHSPLLPPPWDFLRFGHLRIEDAVKLDEDTDRVFLNASAYDTSAYALCLAVAFETVGDALSFHGSLNEQVKPPRHVEGELDSEFWKSIHGGGTAPNISIHQQFSNYISKAFAVSDLGRRRAAAPIVAGHQVPFTEKRATNVSRAGARRVQPIK